MNLQELETAITNLPHDQLTQLASWFDEYRADLWDQQIDQDIAAGKLDKLAEQADAEFEAGNCKPLQNAM